MFKQSYILWIAWRNLTRRNKASGLSFMTTISIAGVAIGVMALIIVLSVMGGFEEDLKNRLLLGRPHVEVISEVAAAGFSLKQHSQEKFKKIFPEALEIQPFTQADVVLKQGKHMTSATLFGINPEQKKLIWGFGDTMTEGSIEELSQKARRTSDNPGIPGVALGEDLAIQLGASLGDEITVFSPQASGQTALGGGTVARHFIVIGTFKTGLFNYDAKWAVTNLSEGRRFIPDYDPGMQLEEYVTGVGFNLEDPFLAREMETRFVKAGASLISLEKSGVQKTASTQSTQNSEFSGLTALTWEKANKSLLFALKLEKFAMGSVLLLIVIVAAFSISGTMMMTVYHRRGQVSLLRSLGMGQSDIAKLYIAHGFTIGTTGIAFGLLLGLGICLLLKSSQFLQLPEGIYQLKFVPVKWLWTDYIVICVSAWLFSLLAAAYPAMTAARQDPGAGLRYL